MKQAATLAMQKKNQVAVVAESALIKKKMEDLDASAKT